MPNCENIRKWVTALESDKYKQGRQCLRFGDQFCCLGVAADLSLKDGVNGEWRRDGAFAYGDVDEGGVRSAEAEFLPWPAMNWLELDDDCPDLRGEDGKFYSAAWLNDELNYTFAQIAQAIRRTYPEAFPEVEACQS
jgi:hypothetical protein